MRGSLWKGRERDGKRKKGKPEAGFVFSLDKVPETELGAYTC